MSEFWENGGLLGLGCLFLASPAPWPQAVALPERDGATLFLAHRWIDRDEFEVLCERAEYDFGGLGWPLDVRDVVLRRVS